MLRISVSLFVGLMLTASSVMAQTTTDPAAPAAPVADGGGLGDWCWLIILIIAIAAAAWYFMRKRTPTGRI